MVDYIYAGRKLIAKEQPGVATRHFISDRLSVRVVVAGGTSIAWLQAHLPFGEEIGLVGEQEKHRFTSYGRDDEAGSDYAVNRQHSSRLGRFPQVDRYRASARIGNPRSFNRYTYAGNDPVNRTDPLGLVDCPEDVPGDGCYFCDPDTGVWVKTECGPPITLSTTEAGLDNPDLPDKGPTTG